MTRRFFLVAMDPMPCGVETWPEDVAQVIFDAFRDLLALPIVIPIDRLTAASAALGSGVPISDVIGPAPAPYTGSHEPDGPCRVTTHVRVGGVCVRCGDRAAGVPGVNRRP